MLDVFHKYYTMKPLEDISVDMWKEDVVKIDNGECIFQIYNSFMYYYNFVKKCNEYQQNIFMPIFRDSNMDENEMLLVIR